jgi:sec-independent protein translocase protein TatC
VDNEFRMSLAGHLTELRSRLIKCVLAVLVLGVAALVFARPIFGLLMQPVLLALPAGQRALVYTSGIEELNVLMKVGLYCGVFLTTPVILWQLWGFVSPGLYAEERRYAAPFVFLGTLAFLLGGLFCYFGVLPSMFQFLLREESSGALEQRLDAARLRADESLRYLRLGEPERAGQVAKSTTAALEESGEGQLEEPAPVPSLDVEMPARLDALGRVLDAAAMGFGPAARGVLRQATDRHAEALEAYARRDLEGASRALDAAAGLIAGAAPTRSEEIAAVWRLQKELANGQARYEQLNWTRPMLTMSEQLSLVLVLLLAFGVIFELPIVMALLGVVGVINSRFLFKYQRHAFVVCLIAAAILTPTGDVVNLSLMGGPMILCYELGLVAVWLIERRRARRLAASGDITPAP